MSNDWQRQHSELYDGDGKPTKAFKRIVKEERKAALHPAPTMVSPLAHDLVREIERASLLLGEARTDQDTFDAFGLLSGARKNLYEYLSMVEKAHGAPRTIALKF